MNFVPFCLFFYYVYVATEGDGSLELQPTVDTIIEMIEVTCRHQGLSTCRRGMGLWWKKIATNLWLFKFSHHNLSSVIP